MRKSIFVILLLGLLFLPLMSIQAQDSFECQMSAQDCMILESSWDATADVHALSFQTMLKVDIESRRRGSDNVSMEIIGGGQFDLGGYVGDNEAQGENESDAAYQARSTQNIINFMNSLTMESSFVITVPGSGFLSSPQSINLDFIIADGMFYMDAAPFMNQGGRAGEPMWFSINMSEYMREYYTPNAPVPTTGSDFDDINDEELFKELVSINRIADTSINGQQSASFEYIFDLSTFAFIFDSEGAVDVFITSFEQQGMSAFEAKLAVEMMKQILLDAQLDAHLYIGLDDQYPQRFEMSFYSDLSKLGMNDLDFIIDVDFSLDMSDFNEPVNIKIPGNAMNIPLSMFAAQMDS